MRFRLGFIFFTFFLLSAKPAVSSTSQDLNLSNVKSLCQSTPYPDVCFDSLKLSVSIDICPETTCYAVQTLKNAVAEADKVQTLLLSITGITIIEKQKGAIQDCKDLHQITLSSLQKSISRVQSSKSQKIEDAKAFLSAALTNKNTCLEGLESASGILKNTLINSLQNLHKIVTNGLSIISKLPTSQQNHTNRHLLDLTPTTKSRSLAKRRHFPKWLSRKSRRILQSSDDEYGPNDVLTVAQDGSGNFTTITDAINFAPNNSDDRIIIYVREGTYHEYVDIPNYKTNIVLLGYGSDVTVVTGSRSVGDGWTTFRSGTVAVSGEGFLARDIAFENTAGPAKHQAVALRVNADFSALYRCVIRGYQDTLYVHSFRQFYRECDILGTVDFIFGNAAAVFQASNIISQLPMAGQFTVITAQSRETEDENTGISIQNCSILATNDLYNSKSSFKSYLGRPWRTYSRTVYIDSFMDDFIDPSGWKEWSGTDGLDTLYYGEYNNNGLGSGTDDRVTWKGYHVMDYYDATNFTVSPLIAGDEWLDSTAFPYDSDI